MSVSVTTREPRPGEVDGIDYHFIDQRSFDNLANDGKLLEHATVFGKSYGTPAGPVMQALEQGRDILFDIDWQGAQQVAHRAGNDLVGIFILPPSTKELERRLTKRAQDPPDVVADRMSEAAEEMSHFDGYDYIVVNEDIDRALDAVISILKAERHRRSRLDGLVDFVQHLQSQSAGRDA